MLEEPGGRPSRRQIAKYAAWSAPVVVAVAAAPAASASTPPPPAIRLGLGGEGGPPINEDATYFVYGIGSGNVTPAQYPDGTQMVFPENFVITAAPGGTRSGPTTVVFPPGVRGEVTGHFTSDGLAIIRATASGFPTATLNVVVQP